MTGPKPRPAAERFAEKVAPRESGCVEWTGALNPNGYGQFYASRGKYVKAHRWAYENQVGPIAGDLPLDHLCRNRKCVNVEHLEPVTQRVNLLRGETVTASHAEATHCPKGHPYAGDNLYRYPGTNWRRCKTCRREGMRLVYRKRAQS